MSLAQPPFRTAAEMAATGATARPAYLDGPDNPFASPARAATSSATAAPRPALAVVTAAPGSPVASAPSSPVAAAIAKTERNTARRSGPSDRVGRLGH